MIYKKVYSESSKVNKFDLETCLIANRLSIWFTVDTFFCINFDF